MGVFLSISEVANLLGISLRAVQKGISVGKYTTRQVSAKGGKGGLRYEIEFSSLPESAQEKYRKQQADAVLATIPVPVQETIEAFKPLVKTDDLSGYTSKQRDVDLAIKTIMRWLEAYPGTLKKAVAALDADHRNGQLSAPLVSALSRCHHKKSGPKSQSVLSLSTVEKWQIKFKAQGNYIPMTRVKDLSVKPWHEVAIALYCRPQKPCYTAVVAELQKLFIPPPTYDQVYDFFTEKFSQSEVLKGRHTGQQLRALQYYKKRTAGGMEPWDEVHADGWNTHFTAPHPVTGEYVTYEVWDFHDVATRFIPPFSIGLTENTEVIAKGIENAIRFGGVMAILMTDSTKIVKNNVKFTGNPVLSIADMAGITITHPVKVGSGQTNGIAENFHSWIDKECRVLGTYQAKGMDSLTLRRTQKLTAKLVKAKANEDSQAVADISKELAKTSKGLVFQTYQEAIDWLEDIRTKWNAKPHSSLKKVRDGISGKMRHQSPLEALEEWKANGWKPVAMDEESLVDLFRPRAKKFVRRGVVKPYGGADGPRFRHKELDHWEGKEVVVSYDIMDYRQVWVMDLRGALICEAPLDEACRYRAQTAADAAQETRALAQIRRLEKKIDTVEKRAGLDAGDIIESTATRVLDYTIDAPAVTPKISMDELYAKVAEQEPEETQQLTAQETWLKYFSTDEDEAEKPVRREIDYGS